MAKRDMGTRTRTNSEIQDRTCVRPSFRSRECCRTGQPRRPVGERRSWRLRAGETDSSPRPEKSCFGVQSQFEQKEAVPRTNCHKAKPAQRLIRLLKEILM